MRRRVNAGLLVALLAALVAGGANVYSSANALRLLHQEQSSVLPASADAAALLASMVDQETGVRGYELTGNAAFLQPYNSGRAQLGRTESRLESELAGHPSDLARLHATEAAYQRWLTRSAEPAIALVRSGQLPVAASPANVAQEKTLFDAVRVQDAALGSGLEAEASSSASQLADQETRGVVLAVVRAVLIVALLALAALAVRRWLLRPIEATAAQVRLVAEEGQIDRQIRPSGPPELWGLAGDVEAMRRRLRDELDVARAARQSLAQEGVLTELIRSELEPSPGLAIPGLSLSGRMLSAEGVLAGDWYDAVALAEGKVAVVVADISGHGPAAGMFALNLKHLLLPVLDLGLEPGPALGWVDGQLDRADEQFASAAVLEIDPRHRTCRWASAGHPSALWIRGDRVETLDPTGPVLGPFGGEWLTHSFELGRQDVVVLYTDGLPEARDAEGRPFGDEELARRALRYSGAGVTELVERLVSGVREHAGGPLTDDATVVAVGLRAGP